MVKMEPGPDLRDHPFSCFARSATRQRPRESRLFESEIPGQARTTVAHLEPDRPGFLPLQTDANLAAASVRECVLETVGHPAR